MKREVLTDRVEFIELVLEPDQLGGNEKVPTPRFTRAARFVFLRGREEVLAQRLQGVRVLVATLRRSSDVMAIANQTTSWQLRDVEANTIYNIRSVEPNREHPRRLLDILCESGT